MGTRIIQCKVAPGANIVMDSNNRAPISSDDIRRLAVPRVQAELEVPYPAVFVGSTAEIAVLTNVAAGAQVFDTETQELKLYTGEDWVTLLTVSTGG